MTATGSDPELGDHGRPLFVEELTPHRRDSDRSHGRMRKGMYILPSLFTTANMAAGFYAILETTQRHRR